MPEPNAVYGNGDNTNRSSAITAKKLWREHQARVDQGKPALRIGLAASFTADTLVPFFGAALLRNDTTAEFRVGPYNQLFQTCLDPVGALGGSTDVIVLLWRIEDLMADEIAGFLKGDGEALSRVIAKLGSFVDAIRQLRSDFSGMVVVGVPPYPNASNGGLMTLDNASGLGAFHRTVAGQFVDEIGRIEGVHLVDLDAVQRQVGAAASFDARH